MKTPTTGLIAVLGLSALLAAGCGSSSKTSTTTAASAYPAAGETTASTATNAPASTTSPATAGTTVVVKRSGKLGTILAAGPKKLTVYLFEADKGPSSSCSGPCASAWPPVTTSGAPTVAGAARSADLGTITRADGTTQVTYKGHPLYYFTKDKDSGDSYGEGSKAFGADWYVLTPSGNKVDNS